MLRKLVLRVGVVMNALPFIPLHQFAIDVFAVWMMARLDISQPRRRRAITKANWDRFEFQPSRRDWSRGRPRSGYCNAGVIRILR